MTKNTKNMENDLNNKLYIWNLTFNIWNCNCIYTHCWSTRFESFEMCWENCKLSRLWCSWYNMCITELVQLFEFPTWQQWLHGIWRIQRQ